MRTLRGTAATRFRVSAADIIWGLVLKVQRLGSRGVEFRVKGL